MCASIAIGVLGVLEAVAGRYAVLAEAQQRAASIVPWQAFSDEALRGAASGAHRWARLGITTPWAEEGPLGTVRSDPLGPLARLRAKWWATDHPSGLPAARRAPFVALLCPGGDARAEAASSFCVPLFQR